QSPLPPMSLRDALPIFHAEGVVDEDGLRPIAAEGAHHVAQEGARVLELAVGIAEHDHVLHAHEVRGGALLAGPTLRQIIGRERADRKSTRLNSSHEWIS